MRLTRKKAPRVDCDTHSDDHSENSNDTQAFVEVYQSYPRSESAFPNFLTRIYVVDKDADDNHGTEGPEDTSPTDIWLACKTGDIDSVRAAIKKSPALVNDRENDRTPLYYASHRGHSSIVRLLLHAGARDTDGSAYSSALNGKCRRLLRPKSKAKKSTRGFLRARSREDQPTTEEEEKELDLLRLCSISNKLLELNRLWESKVHELVEDATISIVNRKKKKRIGFLRSRSSGKRDTEVDESLFEMSHSNMNRPGENTHRSTPNSASDEVASLETSFSALQEEALNLMAFALQDEEILLDTDSVPDQWEGSINSRRVKPSTPAKVKEDWFSRKVASLAASFSSLQEEASDLISSPQQDHNPDDKEEASRDTMEGTLDTNSEKPAHPEARMWEKRHHAESSIITKSKRSKEWPSVDNGGPDIEELLHSPVSKKEGFFRRSLKRNHDEYFLDMPRHQRNAVLRLRDLGTALSEFEESRSSTACLRPCEDIFESDCDSETVFTDTDTVSSLRSTLERVDSVGEHDRDENEDISDDEASQFELEEGGLSNNSENIPSDMWNEILESGSILTEKLSTLMRRESSEGGSQDDDDEYSVKSTGQPGN